MDLQIRTDDGSALCASKPNRKNGLENSALHILRLLCPIIIVTGHWAEPRLNYLQPIAIDVFLAAEGLLLSNLLVRTIDNSQRSAIANAIVRIYPLYLTALALGGLSTIFAVALRVDAWTWPLVIKAAANGLILAPSFSAANHNSVYPFNSPSWAIVAELWFSIALIAARKLLNLPSIWPSMPFPLRLMCSPHSIGATSILVGKLSRIGAALPGPQQVSRPASCSARSPDVRRRP